MTATFKNLLFPLLLALPLTAFCQQDAAPVANAEAAVETGGSATAPEAHMSPVAEEDVVLTTANELVVQASNTVMTAGVCLVVDDLVRQFCSANPGDVSCQFQ